MTFPFVYRGMGVVLVEGPDEIKNEDPPNGKQTPLPEALLLMEYIYSGLESALPAVQCIKPRHSLGATLGARDHLSTRMLSIIIFASSDGYIVLGAWAIFPHS